jgi:6-pyruvoyltetrahydropterin/6-carboxytetrahydropterin synthase
MRATLVKSFVLEAAHSLPALPEGHKCRRLHGHTYVIEVAVEGPVDVRTGMVCDFGELKAAVEPILAPLDHGHLNEVEGLAVPTSERLAKWLWDRLQPRLPGLAGITVKESDSSRCEYRGE